MNLRIIEEKYLFSVQANLALGTYNCYKSHLDYTVKYFEKLGIIDSKELTAYDITKFIIYQRHRGVSNATINKRVGPLKRMLAYCNEEIVDIDEVKHLKEKKVTYKNMSKNNLKQILDYLDTGALKIKNEIAIRLFLDTGVRPSELLRLKRKNIDIENNLILLSETKTDEERYVRFTDRTSSLLKEYIKNMKPNDLVIPSKYKAIYDVFKRIRFKFGLNYFHPYNLRHTHATILIVNKAPIFFISKDMGHKNIKTTERYSHLNFEEHQKFYNECFNY